METIKPSHDSSNCPSITRYNDDFMVLTEDYHFRAWGHKFTIPKGFVTDGASIPWYLRSLAGCPFSPKTMRSVIKHDYMYRNDFPIESIDRHDKDYLLQKDLEHDNNSKVKSAVYHIAVYVAGKKSYAKKSINWIPTDG